MVNLSELVSNYTSGNVSFTDPQYVQASRFNIIRFDLQDSITLVFVATVLFSLLLFFMIWSVVKRQNKLRERIKVLEDKNTEKVQ
jgi:hypothetical protein